MRCFLPVMGTVLVVPQEARITTVRARSQLLMKCLVANFFIVLFIFMIVVVFLRLWRGRAVGRLRRTYSSPVASWVPVAAAVDAIRSICS